MSVFIATVMGSSLKELNIFINVLKDPWSISEWQLLTIVGKGIMLLQKVRRLKCSDKFWLQIS